MPSSFYVDLLCRTGQSTWYCFLHNPSGFFWGEGIPYLQLSQFPISIIAYYTWSNQRSLYISSIWTILIYDLCYAIFGFVYYLVYMFSYCRWSNSRRCCTSLCVAIGRQDITFLQWCKLTARQSWFCRGSRHSCCWFLFRPESKEHRSSTTENLCTTSDVFCGRRSP